MGFETLLQGLSGLIGLAGQAAAADDAQRQKILDLMDAAYREFKNTVGGVDAAIAANDAAADAAAAALPSSAPPPSPLATMTTDALRAELARRDGATP